MTRQHSGFTLIELLVAATIIIVLTTLGLVSYRVAARNSRNAKRKSDLEAVRQAMMMYRSEEGRYPADDNFTDLVNSLKGGNYLAEGEFQDPKYPQYEYQYDSGTLTADLEPGPDNEYSVTLPQ